MSTELEPQPFEVAGRLRGEAMGEGPAVVLCHGITATRQQLLHGSHALPRAGYEVITFDARGHGESEPAP
jgi:alpha-beta hydrolase superfamily lysophospholipase